MAAEAEQYLVVSVAGAYLGLGASDVLKVIEAGPTARLPRLPPEVVGVTAYRGRVVTLVDLATLLGLERSAHDPSAGQVVLLDRGRGNVGLVVDRVAFIARMERLETRERDGDLVTAVGVCGAHAVGVLDGERLEARIARLCARAT